MASETITITITASAGDGPLTVSDAMRQVSDFFEVLETSGGEDVSTIVTWELVSARKESPFQVTARAISKVPGFPAEPIARREKIALKSSFNEIMSGHIPDSMGPKATETFKRMFARTLNGIGRTDILLDPQDAPIIIVERSARTAISAFEATDRVQLVEVDHSRIEMGSVDGDVLLTGPYRGQPAIQVRERLTGQELWCVFSPELAQTVGPVHNWSETWANRRLLLTGQITYGKDGRIRLVYAYAAADIDPKPLRYADIADPNFTGGLSASEYVKSLWEEEVG